MGKTTDNVFRQRAASLIGLVILLIAVAMITAKFFFGKEEFTYLEISLTLGVGWMFLMGKNDMISDFFMNRLNIGNKENKE